MLLLWKWNIYIYYKETSSICIYTVSVRKGVQRFLKKKDDGDKESRISCVSYIFSYILSRHNMRTVWIYLCKPYVDVVCSRCM